MISLSLHCGVGMRNVKRSATFTQGSACQQITATNIARHIQITVREPSHFHIVASQKPYIIAGCVQVHPVSLITQAYYRGYEIDRCIARILVDAESAHAYGIVEYEVSCEGSVTNEIGDARACETGRIKADIAASHIAI